MMTRYALFSALRGDDRVAVPHAHLFCDDAAVLGTEFFLMDMVRNVLQFNVMEWNSWHQVSSS